MLQAVPIGWFSTKYELLKRDIPVGRLEMAWGGESASMEIDIETFRLYREGWMSGPFLLESDTRGILAIAEKTSAFHRSFEVAYNGRTYILEAETVLSRSFVLKAGEDAIGSVSPDGFFGTRSTIELPDSFPVPIQAFMFWLVALLWKRSTDSAATAT